ncbi:methylated-DNA--[protein]-cysteine S-methyltransferase [uncultured Methanobrevibacter sp.]|uniref:methylated-DNA--[protein]-cysteine S-methyltransferase n=1 Tax=uncultured Methanobrevibacter sp. TaxID=253161 RepID=UPI002605C7E2|nr:methylated-DNA--[protein]-cysteine S-methyltransferase [uncultured Methanobrevibacter sp.]
MIYKTEYNSPLGKLTLASKDDKLIGLWINGQKHFFGNFNEETIENDDLEIFEKTKRWLDSYFDGNNPSLSRLDLYFHGSDFRLKVWDLLKEIPYGEVVTYGDIAKKISSNMSSQAVGGAVGHNPISIIVPCHRVVGFNGKLTGYAGSLENKVKLLKLEGVKIKDLKVIF